MPRKKTKHLSKDEEADKTPGIVLEKVTKSFANVVAVNDLSLKLPSHGVVVLLGPNGAGKSTTMRLLAGILRPDSGEVKIKNIDVWENPLPAKRKLGYLPESLMLYDNLTVYEFLRFICRAFDISLNETEELITNWCEFFDLERFRNSFIGDLSKGFKQKVAITSALIHKPEVAILDEPLINLDPKSAKSVRERIETQRNERLFFISTHMLPIAEILADHVIIINHGHVIAEGSMKQLRSKQKKNTSLEDVFIHLTEENE